MTPKFSKLVAEQNLRKAQAALAPATGSVKWFVLGEAVLNFDPRSLSLDSSPTTLRMTSKVMDLPAARDYLKKCARLAPSWKFWLCKQPHNPEECGCMEHASWCPFNPDATDLHEEEHHLSQNAPGERPEADHEH